MENKTAAAAEISDTLAIIVMRIVEAAWNDKWTFVVLAESVSRTVFNKLLVLSREPQA